MNGQTNEAPILKNLLVCPLYQHSARFRFIVLKPNRNSILLFRVMFLSFFLFYYLVGVYVLVESGQVQRAQQRVRVLFQADGNATSDFFSEKTTKMSLVITIH